jgi:peptidoglycan hydrolase-like protein with peptidoglycan-binding domain
MMQIRSLGAVLALGALTACGGNNQSTASAPPSTYATPPASYGTASSGTSGSVAPVSPAMIRQVQATLQQNGDYRGRPDGIWGPMTESGVRTWQQAHSLNPSGEIDVATLQSMDIPAGSEANGQSGQTNANNTAPPTQPNTQPTGNQNYSSGPASPTGSSYSSNNTQMPANSGAPSNQGPSNQGMTGTNTGAASNSAPNANAGNATH